jgi:O-6-methylguanine DNA methyltransferase
MTQRKNRVATPVLCVEPFGESNRLQPMTNPNSISFVTFRYSRNAILLACDSAHLHWLSIGPHANILKSEFLSAFREYELVEDTEPARNLAAGFEHAVENGFARYPPPHPDIGTTFQRKVWAAIRLIKRGQVASYQQLAAMIGHPTATRAAASACGANQVALVIPCHRVVRGDGTLGNYRWGEAIKRQLIEAEQTCGFDKSSDRPPCRLS